MKINSSLGSSGLVIVFVAGLRDRLTRVLTCIFKCMRPSIIATTIYCVRTSSHLLTPVTTTLQGHLRPITSTFQEYLLHIIVTLLISVLTSLTWIMTHLSNTFGSFLFTRLSFMHWFMSMLGIQLHYDRFLLFQHFCHLF